MDVADIHLGVSPPKRFHDTQYLAFLNDPYERELRLKTLTDKHLDMPPVERDELRDWIMENVRKEDGKKIPKSSKTGWAEYIWKAPGDMVAPYGGSDIDRTEKLFHKLRPIIEKRGMLDAYERELACTPITLEMERSGIAVNRKRLSRALTIFQAFDRDVTFRIAKKLRLDPKKLKGYSEGGVVSKAEEKSYFNFNAPHQVADALLRNNKLDSVVKTKSGKGVSTKIEHLHECCNDKELIDLLSVRSVTQKYIGTFMVPWLDQSAMTGGRILPHFNQTRGRGEDGGGGARSGRLSSSNPNMQQVSANVEDSKNKDTLLLVQKWLKADYAYDFIGLRDYIIPDDGMVLIACDYDQQELRILAHFEAGRLMQAYLDNPKLDVHEWCRGLIREATGVDYERKAVKTVVFGLIYGMGITKLASGLGLSASDAKDLRKAVLDAIPGIKKIDKELRRLAAHDEPLITWGGRQYFCEEPRYDARFGRWMSYEHKLLNYLIQPSAADCTKQGMINVRTQVPQARIAIQVHDELVCMARHRKYGPRIAAAMADVPFRVPLSATPKYSEYSWARVA
jgi:DNA polymerase-1